MEIITVVQVDWRHNEYAVSVHDSIASAIETMVLIRDTRKGDGAIIENDDPSSFICGDGWEARLERHEGESHADLHGYAIPKDRYRK